MCSRRAARARISGDADNYTLKGGAGVDILMGGAGDDLYIWKDGDGNDTIVDTQGSNRLIINGPGYNFAGGTMTKQAGSNLWKDPTGNVVLTHNSPWRLELSDGSVIQLGEGFDPANWHLNLVDPNAPGVAADPIKVFLTQPQFTPGEQLTLSTTSGIYTDLSAVPHWVYATQLGEQVITLGDGDDYVDTSRSYAGAPGEASYQSFGADQDRVYAGGGSDTTFTGFGSDYIDAGAGNDTIYSGARGQGTTGIIPINSTEDAANSDQVMAGDGDDRVWGSAGADIVFGEAGIDELWGRGGSDLLYGGDGNDILLSLATNSRAACQRYSGAPGQFHCESRHFRPQKQIIRSRNDPRRVTHFWTRIQVRNVGISDSLRAA